MASSCRECSYNGWDHDEVKHRLKTDLYFLCGFFQGNGLVPDFHLPIIEWHNKKKEEGCDKLLVMQSRGSYKTSVLNIGLNVKLIINNPEIRILIVMHSSTVAESKLSEIKQILESKWFTHFFPEIVPPKRSRTIWTKSQIQVNRKSLKSDPTVMAIGTECGSTGFHFDRIVLDDPIEGTAKDVQIQSDRAQAFLKLLNGLWVSKSQKDLLILGTRWPCNYYDDLVDGDESIMRLNGGAKLIVGSRVDDRWFNLLHELGYETTKREGDPLFDTEEALAEARVEFGMHYAPQMDNNRVDAKGKLFDTRNFKYFEYVDNTRAAVSIDGIKYPLSSMKIQCIVDPASGKHNKCDESAIVILASKIDLGISFLLYAWSGIIPMGNVTAEGKEIQGLLGKTFSIAELYNASVIRPEEGGLNEGFITLLHSENLIRRKSGQRVIGVDPVSPHNASKPSRVATLSPYFSLDRYSIWLAPDGMEQFIREADKVAIVNGELNFNCHILDTLAHGKPTIRMRMPDVKKQDIRVEMSDDDEDIIKSIVASRALICDTRVYEYIGTRQ